MTREEGKDPEDRGPSLALCLQMQIVGMRNILLDTIGSHSAPRGLPEHSYKFSQFLRKQHAYLTFLYIYLRKLNFQKRDL